MTSTLRRYPVIPDGFPVPIRPLSFVCVRYSDEFLHNLWASACVHDELNELIVIDDTDNLRFRTLTAAMIEGMSRARNDLVVFVHEDVVLLAGWQGMFEASLRELEESDPDWRVVGLGGWDSECNVTGHFSDPQGLWNTFTTANFAKVESIDGHVLAVRRSVPVRLDPDLPGIQNIGRDLPWTARELGGASYVINAPSIHKFADVDGKEIHSPIDSVKITRRKGLQRVAEKECSDEYLLHKWRIGRHAHLATVADNQSIEPAALSGEQNKIASSPIVFIGQGRAGTRLMSLLAEDLGLFMGNDLNQTGDSREMARCIYRCIFRKYCCPSDWQRSVIKDDLRNSAAAMLKNAGWPAKWGFKLPETLFVLDEIHEAYPMAKFVFQARDPKAMLVQRPHLTVQLDRPVGQVALRLAYADANIPVERASADGVRLRVALTTRHQLSLVAAFQQSVLESKWLNLRFEDVVSDPLKQLALLAGYCGLDPVSRRILGAVDPKRARIEDDAERLDEALLRIVRPARIALGYEAPCGGCE